VREEIEEKENYNRWRQKTRVGKRSHRRKPREMKGKGPLPSEREVSATKVGRRAYGDVEKGE
jgi:hypothetical protein